MNSKVPVHLLVEGAQSLGLRLAKNVASHLTLYIEELLRWSPKIDLISQTDPAEIIRKHILDSLAVSPHIPEGATILDLGSGAGLPGIPLAIYLTKSQVTLLEARRKRVSFLKTIARDLRLENLTIYEGRAETLAYEQQLRGAFAVVVTRATWDTEQFLHFAAPFVQKTGLAFIMKGPRISNTHNQKKEDNHPAFHLREQREYALPFGKEQRKLLIFTKTAEKMFHVEHDGETTDTKRHVSR